MITKIKIHNGEAQIFRNFEQECQKVTAGPDGKVRIAFPSLHQLVTFLDHDFGDGINSFEVEEICDLPYLVLPTIAEDYDLSI